MSAVAVGSAHTEAVSSYLQGLQARITAAIADIDGTAFLLDAWQKPAG
ncbi:MAG TPA: coproporphyrinogen III oxidase, partial [Rhodoferax sp.]